MIVVDSTAQDLNYTFNYTQIRDFLNCSSWHPTIVESEGNKFSCWHAFAKSTSVNVCHFIFDEFNVGDIPRDFIIAMAHSEELALIGCKLCKPKEYCIYRKEIGARP